jgi:hypothetical protein
MTEALPSNRASKLPSSPPSQKELAAIFTVPESDLEQERLTRGLTELGLAHKVSWVTIDSLVNAPQATQTVDSASSVPKYSEAEWHSLIGSRPMPDWKGSCTIGEVIGLGIDPQNPADGSGLPQRSDATLLADLQQARYLPNTRWLQGWVEAIIAERTKR